MNVGDDFTRETLATKVGFSFDSGDVFRTFEETAFERRLPTTIRFDDGAELTSRKMLAWAPERAVSLHFIEPGRPTQNAEAESFNGPAGDDFLNARLFVSLFDAHAAVEERRADYNECRPHSSLGYLTPRAFAERQQTRLPYIYQLLITISRQIFARSRV